MKKTINMRSGFTMIELVFVIVIIGILSAVALPKFLETANQAHDGIVKSFAGTLNRTVGPTLWAKSIADGNAGVISSLCGTLSTYTEIPTDELTDNSDCTFTKKTGTSLSIGFTDGDSTKAPVWLAS